MKVVVSTPDVVGERMAGPGIRAMHFAAVLAKHFETTLIAKVEEEVPATVDEEECGRPRPHAGRVRTRRPHSTSSEERGGEAGVRGSAIPASVAHSAIRDAQDDAFVFLPRGTPEALDAIRAADVVVTQTARDLKLVRRGQRVVCDLFVPLVIELGELYGHSPSVRQRVHLAAEWGRLLWSLRRADLLIAATKKQIDFYRKLQSTDTPWAVIPFGVEQGFPATRDPRPTTRDPQPTTRDPRPTTRDPQPATRDPQPTTHNPRPATRNPQPATRDPQPATHDPQPTTHDPQPATLVWGGGTWEWLDPALAVDAVVALNGEGVQCHLLFLGRSRPNRDLVDRRRDDRFAQLLVRGGPYVSAADWVPYRERLSWLTRGKVAIMLHRPTAEAAYSIRTRLFDAIAAAIPVIATAEGFAAELVAAEGLGIVVPPSDVRAVMQAVRRLLQDDVFHASCVYNLARIRPRFAWDVVMRPLIEQLNQWQRSRH